MKYLEDPRLTQLSSDLTEAFLNTRGSGNAGTSTTGSNIRNIRGNPNRSKAGRGGKGKKQQQQSLSSTQSKTGSSSPYLPSSTFHYNPAGYTSYDGGTASSSRVIYGKIEAYTTKRAGSDKKTAHEVGERYAHEMEKLNEAVEEMKRTHLLQRKEGDEDDENFKTDHKQKKKTNRNRSCSLDGVTFAGGKDTTSTLGAGLSSINEKNDDLSNKRPLEGILKPPSANKRSRATSFDISTGPSSFEYEGSRRGRLISTGNHDEVDINMHPLMPQPSLYQSTISDVSGKAFSMAPRRLVTDLILTLNASFPDYDFGDARLSDFCTLSVPEAMRRINENMSEFVTTTGTFCFC